MHFGPVSSNTYNNYLFPTEDSKKSAQMSKKAQALIGVAIESVHTAVRSLMEGNIPLATLVFLAENQKRFLTVTECAGVQKTQLSLYLKLRQHEM